MRLRVLVLTFPTLDWAAQRLALVRTSFSLLLSFFPFAGNSLASRRVGDHEDHAPIVG